MELVLNFRPLYWICTLLIGVLGAPINGYLLLKEIRKRRDGFANFASKYMRIFSVSTLRSGFIAALFVALPVFPRFCYLDLSGKAIVFGFPIQCMAWYQLSRLHYCFSNEQIHNRNGYPLSLFIVLIAFGPILLIDWAIVYLVAILCRIDVDSKAISLHSVNTLIIPRPKVVGSQSGSFAK